ncbi:hypothetical protein [Aliiruegeria lutimaris]|uniref:Uncharacterized protein n=1 Tax=Aliiruegeria lutimaris TaxID=571298 RepID=A0A1G8RX84_9RHOB|nr:hypothetical protein [Aliiruegeria lutimaris]SDJ21573.1 hypothetical protein SAMN04488026_10146 [Aliiruegeria lutimaris]
MTAALGNRQDPIVSLRCKARIRRVRPLVWAMIWASLAQVSWLAFKGAQVRLQPDAIATGLPGFLYRLVIQPLEWVMSSFHGTDPALLALQSASLVAICMANLGVPGLVTRTLGGARAARGR